jgi:hypothetical protein
MIWTTHRILQTLRKLHRTGADLAYTQLARAHQPIVSAAAYHFGSYRAAIEAAGIDYAQHLRRPRWTKQRIIALIKQARRDGKDLHWSAVTRRGDELSRAAYASLQRRLFGGWDRALHAAGLDADDVSVYRTWDRNMVLFELKARKRDGEPLNSAALQDDDPALHAAAVRHFGSYERALRAAHVDPRSVRQRQQWSKQHVIRALRKAHARGTHLSDSAVRGQYPALYGAAVRQFGSFPAARRAARVRFARSRGRAGRAGRARGST